MNRTVRLLLPPAAVAVVGLAAIALVGDSPSQHTISVMLISMIFATGWNVIGGYAGQASFGQAAYFGLGAYTTMLLAAQGVPPLLGMWAGVVVAAAAALLIGLLTFRLTGIYFGLSTVVFPIILLTLAIYWDAQELSFPYKVDQGVAWFAPDVPQVLSLIALAATVAAVGIASLIERSRLGLYLHALRSDQGAAEASGVDTMRQKIVALEISAALSAVAGALYCPAVLVLTPEGGFGLLRSVEPVIYTVFGGIGTLWGPLIGTTILHPLAHWLDITVGGTLPGASGLFYGVALLLMILVFPQGLYWGVRARFGRASARPAPPGQVAAAARSPDLLLRPTPATDRDAPTPVPGPVVVAPIVSHAATPAAPPAVVVPLRTGPPVLQLKGVHKKFGGLQVLSDVSFDAHRGEILGVIGPNGAGKTTLFNILNGFIPLDNGQIFVDGRDVASLKPHEVFAAGVGRTFQVVRDFKRLTLAENVTIPARARGLSRTQAERVAADALSEVGLANRAEVLVERLSTGELRRMELARAMCGDSKLLLLDEFLGGLGGEDANLILAVIRRIRDRGVTVVAIEHTMRAMADLVDRFVVLNFGRIVATGTVREVAENPEVIEAYLGKRWAARAAG